MKKIMIIDDDKEFLDEITQILEFSGYETISLSESKHAVKKISEDLPDVVLLDLRMDGVSGFKIANDIKNSSKIKHMPVVGITGFYTEKEHRSYMAVCGIENCLIKPFNPLDVIAVIETVLEKKNEDE
ncbi:MAG: response regulator [Candidatus Saelkia tenebricola]|nr:response regulator [Candidatus Saelkia tenebricola]